MAQVITHTNFKMCIRDSIMTSPEQFFFYRTIKSVLPQPSHIELLKMCIRDSLYATLAFCGLLVDAH